MSKLNPLKRPMEITAEYLAAQKPVKKLQTNETNNNLMAVDANKSRPAPSARVNIHIILNHFKFEYRLCRGPAPPPRRWSSRWQSWFYCVDSVQGVGFGPPVYRLPSSR